MKRWSLGLTLAVMATSAVTLHAQEAPPAVLAWTHSLDAFASQSKALLEQLGLGPTAVQFEGLVKAKLGPKGFAGIDGTRPIGAFLRFDPDPSVALVVPIGQEKDFFDLLDRFAIKSTKENDGTYRLAVPLNFRLPIPVFAKVAGRHAWITILNKNAFNVKTDPSQLFPQTAKLASVRVRLDLIPKDARQLAISQFEDRLQQALKQNPPADTPAQKAFTGACNQALARMFAQTLEEGKELAFDVAFEPGAKGLLVGMTLTPKSNTPLAKSLADAGQRPSAFAVSPKDASALVARLNVAAPAPVAKALAQVIEEGYQEGMASLRDPANVKQAKELLDALKPSLEAGEIDAVLRLVGPSGEQKMGAVVGIKAKGADRLGSLFKSLAQEARKQMTEAEQAKVMLDADAVGATKIHRFVLPADRSTQDILGESILSVAFRPDAVLAGIGWESLAAVKALAGTGGGPAPLAQITIDVAQLAPLMSPTPKLRDAARAIFTQKGDGLCQFEVTGGNQLGMNLVIRTPVLRFLGQTRAEHAEEKK